jgi:hypothetical protein
MKPQLYASSFGIILRTGLRKGRFTIRYVALTDIWNQIYCPGYYLDPVYSFRWSPSKLEEPIIEGLNEKWAPIDKSDLPLYINMSYKSILFEKILEGSVYKRL